MVDRTPWRLDLGGEDIFNDEARDIWRMLDNLHSSNPKAYHAFIAERTKEMQDMIDVRCTPGFIIPEKGFVVKVQLKPTSIPSVRQFVFINFCTHKLIGKPHDINGSCVDECKTFAENLYIPFALSPLRDAEDENGNLAHVIDVVSNHWCIYTSLEDNDFKNRFVLLVVTTIRAERNVHLFNSWHSVNLSYVSCEGKSQDEISPFPIDTNEPLMLSKSMDTPDALLKAAAVVSQESSKKISFNRKARDRRFFIQDISPSNNSTTFDTVEEKESIPAKLIPASLKTEPLVSKGFLINKSRALFHDAKVGGSGMEGGEDVSNYLSTEAEESLDCSTRHAKEKTNISENQSSGRSSSWRKGFLTLTVKKRPEHQADCRKDCDQGTHMSLSEAEIANDVMCIDDKRGTNRLPDFNGFDSSQDMNSSIRLITEKLPTPGKDLTYRKTYSELHSCDLLEVDLSKASISTIHDISIDIEGKNLRISTTTGYRLNVVHNCPFGFVPKARFKKKTKQLNIFLATKAKSE